MLPPVSFLRSEYKGILLGILAFVLMLASYHLYIDHQNLHVLVTIVNANADAQRAAQAAQAPQPPKPLPPSPIPGTNIQPAAPQSQPHP